MLAVTRSSLILCSFILAVQGLALPFADAKDLNALALYRRCYIHLTGETPQFNDANIPAVRAGTKDPIRACLDLLEAADLDPNDAEGKLKSPSNETSVKILNNLYELQLTFVKNKVPAISNFLEDFSSTDDIYDHTAVGLALTEAVLNPDRNFSDIFTQTKTPTAKRVLASDVVYPFTMFSLYGGSQSASVPIYGARTRHGETYFADTAMTSPVNPDGVPYSLRLTTGPDTFMDQTFDPIQVGRLAGIHYKSPARTLSTGAATYSGLKLVSNFDINSPVFPGIQFNRSYILANAALSGGNSQRSNLAFMHRRFSQSLLRDFLCRELPVLRESDITSYMSADANALTFRQASSCLRCHATIDQLAGSFRGLGYMSIGDRTPTTLKKFAAHASYWASTAASSTAETTGSWVWPAVADASFYMRPQKGRFLYRTVSGKLVNRTLASASDVGPLLKDLDDTYTCYARNMFRHFTGVRVELFDPGDPTQAARIQAMSAKDWAYLTFVTKLGKELKDKNKARVVLEEIMKSDFYRSSDALAGGSQ